VVWEARGLVRVVWDDVVDGRLENWSEGAETVLAVDVWSERVFFLLYIFFELSRFHSAHCQLSYCQRIV